MIMDRDARLIARLSLLPERVILDRSVRGRQRLITSLERICRKERERGLAGDWKYDLARHRGLCAALEREQTELAAMLGADVKAA